MIRKIILILMIVCLFCAAGCSNDEKIEVPANFYYCKNTVVYNEDNAVIAPERREIKFLQDDIKAILNHYLQGPLDEALYNPFPDNTVIEAAEYDSNTLILTLNDSYSQLSGLELTLASSCLAKTAMELTEQQAVRVQCSNTALDGNPFITITKDSLILVDMTQVTTVPTE